MAGGYCCFEVFKRALDFVLNFDFFVVFCNYKTYCTGVNWYCRDALYERLLFFDYK